MFIPFPGKTTNIYILPPQDYKKLLHENTTKYYKKSLTCLEKSRITLDQPVPVCKSEIRKISKSILENINMNLVKLLQVNQWRDLESAIEWFYSTENKSV